MPVNIIVLGMAGTGKTTFVDQFTRNLAKLNKKSYIVNLDPAVHHIPYNSNIDIRDTIKYKEVMNQYGFGPNGAIMTSLNFFTSQFHKVVDIISKKTDDYIIFDTPGQIEVFTWSASGMIITETLSSINPTIILYIVDTPRCRNPVTFMSNMLYACSVMYKMKLPLLCIFNKTDVISADFAIKWMQDFEEFQEALSAYNNDSGPSDSDKDQKYAHLPCYNVGSSYMTSLTNSMSLVLDEFYSTISSTGFSSKSGEGMEKLLDMISTGVIDYEENYKVRLEKKKQRKMMHMLLDEIDKEVNDEDENEVSFNSNSSKGSRPCSPIQTMLIDMVGNEDKADDDLNLHLNAEEETPSSLLEKENEDIIEAVSNKIMSNCKLDKR